MQKIDLTKTSDNWVVQGWEEKVSYLVVCAKTLTQEIENSYMAWKTLQQDKESQSLSDDACETFRLHLRNLLIKQGAFAQILGYELQGLYADDLSYAAEEIKDWKNFLKKEMTFYRREGNYKRFPST